MTYIGSGTSRFNTADRLTVTGISELKDNVTVTGTVTATSFSGDGSTLSGINTDLVSDTSPQLGGDLQSNGHDIVFADNDKAIFGAGSDLQITHTGSHSQIVDSGTGGLFIGGSSQIGLMNAALNEYMVNAVENGAVTLYHDNSAKIATTSTGVSVTGQVIATKGSTGTLATFTDGVATNFTLKTDGSSVGTFGTEAGGTQLAFMVAGTEAARFDGSRNLLVGKTSVDYTTVGFEATPSSSFQANAMTANGKKALLLARKTSDGDIVEFRKDSTVVGSIKAGNGDLLIGTGDVNLRFFDATPAVIPRTASDGTSNTVVDLGNVSNSFKDLYSQRVKGAAGHTGEVHFTGSHDIRFVSNGNEKARFTGDNFVVGSTNVSPVSSNDSNGCAMRGAGQLEASRSDGSCLALNRTVSGDLATFFRATVGVGTISCTSSGTTYNTTSDIRLKQDIEPLEATDKLMQMNPVSYSWKADSDGPRSMGFIAQEMVEVMPEAVSTGDDGMMHMDYGRITPILVSALQDAHRKIEQLEQRIADMEAK